MENLPEQSLQEQLKKFSDAMEYIESTDEVARGVIQDLIDSLRSWDIEELLQIEKSITHKEGIILEKIRATYKLQIAAEQLKEKLEPVHEKIVSRKNLLNDFFCKTALEIAKKLVYKIISKEEFEKHGDGLKLNDIKASSPTSFSSSKPSPWEQLGKTLYHLEAHLPSLETSICSAYEMQILAIKATLNQHTGILPREIPGPAGSHLSDMTLLDAPPLSTQFYSIRP